MKINQVNKKIQELKLPQDQKDNLIELIDLKIESDMDKAITRFEAAVNSLKSETMFIKWLIGGVFAAITILLAIVSFKK